MARPTKNEAAWLEQAIKVLPFNSNERDEISSLSSASEKRRRITLKAAEAQFSLIPSAQAGSGGKDWPHVRRRKNPAGTVSYVVDTMNELKNENGEIVRVRKAFRDLKHAEAFAQKLKIQRANQGIQSFALSEKEASEAIKAFRLAREGGFSGLVAAVEVAVKHYATKSDVTVDEVKKLFLEAKKSGEATKTGQPLRSKSIKELEHRTGLFSKDFGSRLIKSISKDELGQWLEARDLQPQGRRNLVRVLQNFFNFAADSGFVTNSPVATNKFKVEPREPSFLSLEEARSLLRTAYNEEGRPLLGYLVLGMFCGLRPESELMRLEWVDVRLSPILDPKNPGQVMHKPHVFIRPGRSKNNTSIRRVEIPSCAIQWLLCCQRDGLVPPSDNYDKVTVVRRRLVRNAFPPQGENGKPSRLYSWPPDILRHTFASMHFAYWNDEESLIRQMGHVNGAMLRYYRNAGIEPQSAAEFWMLTPDRVIGKASTISVNFAKSALL